MKAGRPSLRPLERWLGAAPFYLLGGLILSAALALVILGGFNFGQKTYQPGSLATETIKSPRAVTYKSDILTKQSQDQAAAEIRTAYLSRDLVIHQLDKSVADFLGSVADARAASVPEADKIQKIKTAQNLQLSDQTATTLATITTDQLATLNSALQGTLDDLEQNQSISQANLDQVRSTLDQRATASGLPTTLVPLLSEISRALVVPNQVVDQNETTKLKDQARDRVSPVIASIDNGEVIFLSGQKITPLDIERLEAVGLARPSFKLERFLGQLIIVLLVASLSALYFQIFRGSEPLARRSFMIYATLLVATVLVAKFALPIKPIFAYLYPAPAFPLLIYLLIDLPTALLAALFGALSVGLIAGSSFELFTIQLVAALSGLFAAYQISRLSSFLRVMIAVMVGGFAASFAFLLLTTGFQARLAGPLVVAAIALGILSVVVVIGSAVFISRIFRVTTFITLLELESPSHPLLADLMFRAPGTYHHSIILGNMAERAAREVGANPLLTRVAVYYHDVGKMLAPEWFIENQEQGGNPHDELANPKESARRIIGHVTDGEKLASEHHLPDEVLHIIRSHHGTMTVDYFLAEAKKKGGKIDPEDYRYPGPLPVTKEAGIVMLADGIEAMARSLDDPTPEDLQQAIDYIVEDRKQKGQLNNAPLTFQDLETIKLVFADVLSAVYHERIKYPHQERRAARRR